MKINHIAAALAITTALHSERACGIDIYESFDYAKDSALHAQAGGTGFSSTEWNDLEESETNEGDTISANSLAFGSLATSGNSLRSTSLELGSNLTRRFDTVTGVTDQTTWISFLVRVSDVPGGTLRVNDTAPEGSSSPISDTFFMSFASVTSRLFHLGVFLDPSNNLLFGLRGTAADPVTFTSIAPVIDSVYLVVASIGWNTTANVSETIKLFINPTLGGAAPTSSNASLSYDLGAPNTGANNRIRDLAIGTTYNAVWTVDELRINDSFALVTPIPEPSSCLLTCFGIGLLVLRRRQGR